MDHSHKSGSLKQSNKGHKQGKTSKRSTKIRMGGRVEDSIAVSVKDRMQSKKDRANEQRQLRSNKRKVYLEKRRTGAGNAYPSVVALIPLGANVDTRVVLKQIIDMSSGCDIRYSTLGSDGFAQPVTIVIPKNKSRLTFVCTTQSLEQVLDIAKVSDLCVFVSDIRNGEEMVMNDQADLLLTSLRTQGMPSSVGLMTGLASLTPKLQISMKKYSTRLFQTELGVDTKIFDDNHIDSLLRGLTDLTPQTLFWRQMRSYMLAEEVAVIDGGISQANSLVTDVCVRGYIHGSPLSVYDAVHITGEGSHILRVVRVLPDPSPLKKSHVQSSDYSMELIADPTRLPSLQEEADIDASSIQQPQWQIPSEFEAEHATIANTEAIWREVVGDELYEDDADRREHELLMELDGEHPVDDEMDDTDFDAEDYEDFNRKTKDTHRVVQTEEERVAEAAAEAESPDVVEVPLDTPARYRFIKYRGLQSFRSSPWDSKENLPVEYASLFQFDNYNAMQKAALERQESRMRSGEEEPLAVTGQYVEMVISGVSRAWVASHRADTPVLVSSLLPHEEKMTVVHCTVQRSSTWFSDTVKSRDLMTCHMGFRHTLVHPIYSDGDMKCDKNKYVKYLPPTGFYCCSFYAPMTYRPCPVILFKPRSNPLDEIQLVGIGSVNKASTDDIILKKAILTGTPFKVRRKMATVRHMFYDPKDIMWFKPVELHTKLGSVGHIREPLGMHGYMKCIFNEQMNMQDEVRLSLYKRVYPRKCSEEEKNSFI